MYTIYNMYVYQYIHIYISTAVITARYCFKLKNKVTFYILLQVRARRAGVAGCGREWDPPVDPPR